MLFIISTLVLLFIAGTMLVRGNDLRWQKGVRNRLRAIGFVLAGVAPFGIILVEHLTKCYPSAFDVMFRVGIAAVFATTPRLPPWWRYWSKNDDHSRMEP